MQLEPETVELPSADMSKLAARTGSPEIAAATRELETKWAAARMGNDIGWWRTLGLNTAEIADMLNVGQETADGLASGDPKIVEDLPDTTKDRFDMLSEMLHDMHDVMGRDNVWKWLTEKSVFGIERSVKELAADGEFTLAMQQVESMCSRWMHPQTPDDLPFIADKYKDELWPLVGKHG